MPLGFQGTYQVLACSAVSGRQSCILPAALNHVSLTLCVPGKAQSLSHPNVSARSKEDSPLGSANAMEIAVSKLMFLRLPYRPRLPSPFQNFAGDIMQGQSTSLIMDWGSVPIGYRSQPHLVKRINPPSPFHPLNPSSSCALCPQTCGEFLRAQCKITIFESPMQCPGTRPRQTGQLRNTLPSLDSPSITTGIRTSCRLSRCLSTCRRGCRL